MEFLSRNKHRESNFELLRIFAMFLIIISHCAIHGIIPYYHQNVSILDHFNNFFISFLLTGEIGVTLFVLLTGYFSCQKKFSAKKLITVYLKTLILSILILIIFCFIDPDQTQNAIKYSFLPFSQEAYWFITCWLLLYIFSPFLNTILQQTPSEIIRKYLLLGLILWVIIPFFDFGKMEFSNLLYFMYLYLLGGSIKLGYFSFSKKILLLLFGGIFTLVLVRLIFEFLSLSTVDDAYKYVSLNSPYTLFVSLSIFYLFKNIKIKNSSINLIASSTLGVYLLHDNNLVRPYLWHKLLRMDRYMTSPFYLIHIIIISLCVFGICIFLDKLLSLMYIPLINKIENKLSKLLFKQ